MDYGAGLIIYNPKTGKILMTRRSGVSTYAGHWDFPGGGLEDGEDSLEGALREGTEELGSLPRLKIDLKPVWWQRGQEFAFATFLAYLEPSETPWEPEINFEHDEWGWFSPRNLPGPLLPGPLEAARYFFRTA